MDEGSWGGTRMKVLVVDDHEIARDGIKVQLADLSDSIELDEAATCTQAITFTQRTRYDLVLLDLNLRDTSAMETLVAFRKASPETPVVVLSGIGNRRLVREVIDAGAMAFIPKRASRIEIVAALRKILEGGVYLPDLAFDGDIDSDEARDRERESVMVRLTVRQLQVLRRAIEGKPNKVISGELDLSTHTVKAHLSAAMRVLGVSNRTEAVYKAATLGIALGG